MPGLKTKTLHGAVFGEPCKGKVNNWGKTWILVKNIVFNVLHYICGEKTAEKGNFFSFKTICFGFSPFLLKFLTFL